MEEQISIVRCPDYHYPRVLKKVKEVLDPLGGIGAFVSRGDRVLLKPNLLYAKHPDRAVTTHPAMVQAVAELVVERGAVPIIGDSPGVGSLRRVAAQAGITQVAEHMDCALTEFTRVVGVRTDASFTFRKLEVAKAVLEVDVVINLPKVKTHGMMLLTLAVKNTFGCVPGMRKAQWHLKAGIDHLHFAGMLVELCKTVSPAVTITDGIVAMEGNGPGGGDPRRLGLIMAGKDPVALDTAVCRIVGLPPSTLPTVQAAQQRGLGQAEHGPITVRGEPIEAVMMRDFRVPKRHDLQWNLPGFMKRPLKRIVVPKTAINPSLCKACGTCIAVCPAKAIVVRNTCAKIDYGKCIRC